MKTEANAQLTSESKLRLEEEGEWCDEPCWRTLLFFSPDAITPVPKLAPNAFAPPENTTTNIHLEWPVAPSAAFEVLIYDLMGQPIRHLLRGQEGDGKKALVWDGKNDSGEPMSAGQYWYRVIMDKRIYSKMLILVH